MRRIAKEPGNGEIRWPLAVYWVPREAGSETGWQAGSALGSGLRSGALGQGRRQTGHRGRWDCDVSLQRCQTIPRVALTLGWLCRVVLAFIFPMDAGFGLPQEKELTVREAVLFGLQGTQLRAIRL